MINIDDTTLYTVEEIVAFAQKEGIPLDTTRPSFQRMMDEFNRPFVPGETDHGN